MCYNGLRLTRKPQKKPPYIMIIVDKILRRPNTHEADPEDALNGRMRILGGQALHEISELLLRPIDKSDIATFGSESIDNLVDACRQYMMRELPAVKKGEYLLSDAYQCLVKLFQSEHLAGQILDKLIEYEMAEINGKAHIVFGPKKSAEVQQKSAEPNTTIQ